MSQQLKLSQSLAITPQLKQAIKMLTLTHLEMANIVAEEMVENPMLEEASVDIEVKKDERANAEKDAKAEDFNEQNQMSKSDDFDWDSYISTYSGDQGPTVKDFSAPSPDEAPNYENIISKGQSLAEHLSWQLKMDGLKQEEWAAAEMIIHSLNDDGYLNSTFDEVVKDSHFDNNLMNIMRERIQQLDPIGCAAENLKECLLIQAKILNVNSHLVTTLITDHLDDLKYKEYAKIAKKLNVDQDSVELAASQFSEFNPKPGRLISPGEVQYVTPDIFIIEMNGEFIVRVNDDGIPRLKISKMYKDLLSKSNEDKESRDYVQEKMKSAMWLIKSVQNRQSTIYKVADAIVKKQQDFFKKGSKYLKPMILKDVAAEIEMHESTVSRVTTNKYMHTPIGTFELKYFFNAGIGGNNGGNDVAGEVVKIKIKELIKNENSKKPLSDQVIADILKTENMVIARRTVAKYREILGIMPSSKRKLRA